MSGVMEVDRKGGADDMKEGLIRRDKGPVMGLVGLALTEQARGLG